MWAIIFFFLSFAILVLDGTTWSTRVYCGIPLISTLATTTWCIVDSWDDKIEGALDSSEEQRTWMDGPSSLSDCPSAGVLSMPIPILSGDATLVPDFGRPASILSQTGKAWTRMWSWTTWWKQRRVASTGYPAPGQYAIPTPQLNGGAVPGTNVVQPVPDVAHPVILNQNINAWPWPSWRHQQPAPDSIPMQQL
jgi:hypothetical protein